jgi:diguanylate cyclase (GGDEF)-like protein/PAS domain S-box-containing protein
MEAGMTGSYGKENLEITSDILLDSLFDGVYFVDVNRRITYWNSAAERISGYGKSDVVGSCCADNLLRHIDASGRELCLGGCPLAATILDGNIRESSVYLHHKLGHRVPVSVRTAPVRDEQGQICGAVEIFSDNSSSLQILHEYERLKQEAYLDPLTGIGNRRYGEMTLASRMYDFQNHDIPFGLLFMDIDHFKKFNDRYGHKTGDDVLVMVANSIAGSLRKMDVVARWGGEEFIVILPGATRIIVKSVSERIRMLIGHSFILAGEEKLQVTVSIGATMSRPDDTVETMVNRADRLMYVSKDAGRNRVTED